MLRQATLAMLVSATILSGLHAADLKPISSTTIHLGKPGAPEWNIFENRAPAAEQLQLKFEATKNEREQTLFIRQDDVKHEWPVELNGRRLGALFLMEDDLVHALAVPPGALRDGANELRIYSRTPEDILIHQIAIADAARSVALSEARLRVEVYDENDRGLPCRITIVDQNGTLAALQPHPDAKLAVRPGVIYTGDGLAEVGARAGSYTVYATRGPEYALAKTNITVAVGATGAVRLVLKREVLTESWVAVDTHIHTLTLSGHGDATLQERMLTLAGEGVELPVCTEHNLHADYTEAAHALGLSRYFTPVRGNEVTTKKGHFNIFPTAPGSNPPDWKIEHWPDLIEAIRNTPGVQVVILNHPHDTHSGFVPFASTNLNPQTGANLRGFDFSFDGMELINSGAMRSDWMEPFRSWFALLNRGHRIVGVGASDSHDVSRFIVGQGRTYIRADDSNPGAIDMNRACQNLKAGRAVISLGLFPELVVNRNYRPGDLVPDRNELAVRARALAPAWMQATNLELYANGTLLRKASGANTEWKLPRREHDYYLVLIATGPGMTEPYWAQARPYQPTSRTLNPVVIGATNPIWIDADGDGKFSAPREYAKRLLAKHRDDSSLRNALALYDPAVAAHVAELQREPLRPRD